jgi:hypothetical protein
MPPLQPGVTISQPTQISFYINLFRHPGRYGGSCAIEILRLQHGPAAPLSGRYTAYPCGRGRSMSAPARGSEARVTRHGALSLGAPVDGREARRRKVIRCGHSHSGLIPANLISLAHFSVSSAMNLPKSAGESVNTIVPPCIDPRLQVCRYLRLLLRHISLVPATRGTEFYGTAMVQLIPP